jgi:hypothetical protein
LAGLSDVSLTGPTGTTQALVWNGDIQKWQNRELCIPMGEIFALGTDTTGPIPTYTLAMSGTVNVWALISPPYTLVTNDAEFPSNVIPLWANKTTAGDNALQWLGDDDQFVHVAFSMCASIQNNSADVHQIGIFKNGTIVQGSVAVIDFTANNIVCQFAFHKVIEMAQNDYIDVRARNTTNGRGNNMVFTNVNLVGVCCCPA